MPTLPEDLESGVTVDRLKRVLCELESINGGCKFEGHRDVVDDLLDHIIQEANDIRAYWDNR